MNLRDTYKEKDIEVYAFGSTDIGVSFVIIFEGITIFHAGDLNYWSWKKESNDAEITQSYDMFDAEIKKSHYRLKTSVYQCFLLIQE